MPSKFQFYQSGSSFFSNKKEAMNLCSESYFGELKEGKVIYSVYEAFYLLEKKKAELVKDNKKIRFEQLLHSIKDRRMKASYTAFKDLRDKGYVLKEGLKFGVDFRVYEKDAYRKDHAKYLLYILSEKEKLDLRNFSARSRVAHSTNKKLLMAIVDSEEDVTYFEIDWKKL